MKELTLNLRSHSIAALTVFGLTACGGGGSSGTQSTIAALPAVTSPTPTETPQQNISPTPSGLPVIASPTANLSPGIILEPPFPIATHTPTIAASPSPIPTQTPRATLTTSPTPTLTPLVITQTPVSPLAPTAIPIIAPTQTPNPTPTPVYTQPPFVYPTASPTPSPLPTAIPATTCGYYPSSPFTLSNDVNNFFGTSGFDLTGLSPYGTPGGVINNPIIKGLVTNVVVKPRFNGLGPLTPGTIVSAFSLPAGFVLFGINQNASNDPLFPNDFATTCASQTYGMYAGYTPVPVGAPFELYLNTAPNSPYEQGVNYGKVVFYDTYGDSSVAVLVAQ